jgi:hypothetical protein
MHCNIYTIYNISTQSAHAFETEQSRLLTWRTSFFAHGDKCPSTLVPGLPTTAPPLALPLSPFHTLQFKLHSLHKQHQQQPQSSLSGTTILSSTTLLISRFPPFDILYSTLRFSLAGLHSKQ